MKHDLDVRYSIDEISDKILDELYENAHKYKDYHTGSVRKLIEDSIKYLKETKYTLGSKYTILTTHLYNCVIIIYITFFYIYFN